MYVYIKRWFDSLNLIHSERVTICVIELSHNWFREWFVACSVPRHYLSHYWLLFNHTIRNKPDKKNVTLLPRTSSWLYITTHGLCKTCVLRNILTQCIKVVCTGPMLAYFLIKWDVVVYVLSPRQLGQITFAALWSRVLRQQIILPALLQFCCRRLVRTLLFSTFCT